MRKTRIGFALILTILLALSVSMSHADEVSQVRAAIASKQARWQAGETSMTRLSPEQRQARLGLIKPTGLTGLLAGAEVVVAGPYVSSAPSGFDWRNIGGENFVTSVRNQGSCGSCWAFATTAALEASTLRSNNTPGAPLDLSEQVLVSCGTSGGNDAGSCSSGYINRASDYIRDTGLPAEECYPYTASDGSCGSACGTYQTSTTRIQSWSWVTTEPPTVTVSAIRNALLNYGPLVTTMEVYSDFDTYLSGVYTHTSGTYRGAHAVLIVGFSDSGQYFIVKNSWGTDWGESGYFKISYSEISSVVEFGYYTIRYKGTACSYLVTPSSQSFNSSGGSGSADVWTQSGCSWSASSNVGWVTTSSSGTGESGSASFSVAGQYRGKSQNGYADDRGAHPHGHSGRHSADHHGQKPCKRCHGCRCRYGDHRRFQRDHECRDNPHLVLQAYPGRFDGLGYRHSRYPQRYVDPVGQPDPGDDLHRNRHNGRAG